MQATGTFRTLAVFLSGIVTAAGLAVSAKADEVVLKGAVFVPPTTTFGLPFKRFVDHVNETGKGLVQIRLVGGPEAVPGTAQADAVKSGVLDLASVPPAYYKSAMVEGDAQILSNMTVGEQRASGAYAMLNKIANEKLNAYYLTTYGMGLPFHLYVTKDMALAKPEDLSGLRFRGAPNYNAIFKKYNIAGVNVAAPEVFTALDRGTVQGYGWPLWGIEDFGWDKLTKMRIDPGFYSVVTNIIINKQKYESLTPEQRKVIDDAVVWFEKDDAIHAAAATKTAYEVHAKRGIKAVDFGPEFKKVALDLYWEDLTKLSPEAIAKLRPLLVKK